LARLARQSAMNFFAVASVVVDSSTARSFSRLSTETALIARERGCRR
jgi:hypothetical protein